MEKPTKVASAIALTFLLFIGGLVAIPFLAVAAAGDSPSCGATGPVEVEDDGTPSLLGPSTLTVADLRAWWSSSGRGQPARLQMDIGDLIATCFGKKCLLAIIHWNCRFFGLNSYN